MGQGRLKLMGKGILVKWLPPGDICFNFLSILVQFLKLPMYNILAIFLTPSKKEQKMETPSILHIRKIVRGQTLLHLDPVGFWWLEQITYLDMFYTYLEARNCLLPNFKLLQRGAILNSKMAANIKYFFLIIRNNAHFADRM